MTPSEDPKVTALRSDIEQTRADLGETVEALAAKADVKARAQDKVADVKERASEAATEAKARAASAASDVRDSGREMVRNPSVAVSRVRTSVREKPKHWAVAAAAVLAFALLVVRKRRAAVARRTDLRGLRDDWKRQWKENR